MQDLPLAGRAAQAGSVDLPLFASRRAPDDAPLVTPPAVPRPPLSVRRASPVGSRARTSPASAAEELEFDLQTPPSTGSNERSAEERPSARVESVRTAERDSAHSTRSLPLAPRGARIVAGVVDLLIAGAIDSAVVYFTLQLCGLTLQEIGILPKPPLIGFLLMLNGGYFVLFTAAGGQTIGKMLTGIRVVSDPDQGGPPGRVTLQAALLRGIVYFLALLPAGAAHLPALVSEDRRGLHDRLARTYVVKA